MDERDFFDKLAPDWDANETQSTPDKVNFILDFFDIRPGDSVLDLGTGTGVLLPFISQRTGESGKIMAVDYSEGMLRRARKKFSGLNPQPEFLNLDFENDTIPGEFDRIILYCVYPHLHTPFDTLKWLRKVNLKPGGYIFIAFPCSEEFINNIHREKHSESGTLPNAATLAKILKENDLPAEAIHYDNNSYIVRISS